jgi:hypothetical protein
MDHPAPLAVGQPVRSEADRRMRRLLRLPEHGARGSLAGAQSAFQRSVFISATRCLITYVVLPVVGPLMGLTNGVGPVLGLVLSAVSVVAIVAATRRFFAADHRWRWRYTAIGGSILVLLFVQSVIDVATLAG